MGPPVGGRPSWGGWTSGRSFATLRDNDGNMEAARDYLDLPARLMDAAVTYYGAYKGEIDEEIDANDREADEAYAAWLAGREAVGS
jgi:hypothetical protein